MVYASIALFFGLATGLVGRMKGSSFILWFLLGAVVPLVGLACALLYRSDREELRRVCPGCGRMVMLHDAKCMGCGEELEFPELAVESAASAERSRSETPAY